MGSVSYLRADYAVVCSTTSTSHSGGSSDHVVIQLWASLAILCYSLGIPLAYAWLLYKVLNEVLNSDYSELSAELSFLHEPFKPPYFWWEIVLVLQKLILVGLFVLEPFQPGSFVQLMLGMSVSLIFTVIQIQVQPYRSKQDNLLATACSISLFSFFLGSVLYRVHELTTDFDAVSAQLSSSWASKRFTLSSELISALMFASTFGSIGIMVVLQCIELLAPKAEVFEWQTDHSQVVPPPLTTEQFHMFLSHNWATGQVGYWALI